MRKINLNIQELLSENVKVYIPTLTAEEVNEAVQYWRASNIRKQSIP
jgi:hypothetical protein